jgi:hypothetical protein
MTRILIFRTGKRSQTEKDGKRRWAAGRQNARGWHDATITAARHTAHRLHSTFFSQRAPRGEFNPLALGVGRGLERAYGSLIITLSRPRMIEKLFVRLARAGARAFPSPPPRGCLQRLTQACHLPPGTVQAVAVAACNGVLLAPGPSTGTAWPFVFLGVAGGMVAGSTGTVECAGGDGEDGCTSIAALGAYRYADRSPAAGGDAAILGVLQGKSNVGQFGLSGTGGQP